MEKETKQRTSVEQHYYELEIAGEIFKCAILFSFALFIGSIIKSIFLI